MNDEPSLASRWRADAEILRRYGCRRATAVLERCAGELDAELRRDVYVDLAEAETLTGYSRSHLRRLLREGALANHGSGQAPRFRAGDLPRKPGYRAPAPARPERAAPTLREIAHAVVSRGGGG